MAQHLSDRIRAALQPTSRLADVRTVLAEAQKALSAANAAKADAEERRVDPLASAEEAAQSQADVEEHQLEALRYDRAAKALQERVDKIESADAARLKQQQRDAIVVRRDALAAKLKDRGPPLLEELAGLIRELDASNAEIEGTGLESAEAIARGVPAFGFGSHPPSLRKMRIPHFGPENIAWTMWPDQLKENAARAAYGAQEHKKLLAIRAANTPEALAAAAARVEASYKRYEVQQEPYSGSMVMGVQHRGGVSGIGHISPGDRATVLQMTEHQVGEARKKGLKVTLVTEPEWQQYRVGQQRKGATTTIATRTGLVEIGGEKDCTLNTEQARSAERAGLKVSLIAVATAPTGSSARFLQG